MDEIRDQLRDAVDDYPTLRKKAWSLALPPELIELFMQRMSEKLTALGILKFFGTMGKAKDQVIVFFLDRLGELMYIFKR